jgi:tRNA dimethylallyltransferase
MRPRVLVVTGPTASGKTSAALEVCLRLGGELVSADSMQVYRGMDIGTAKSILEERKGVPHHLIDVIDPNCPFSVADYALLARAAIREVLERGRIPVVCGGTGQYVSALVDELTFHSSPPDEIVRKRLHSEAESLGNDAMLERLRLIDPESAARLHPNDRRRILRALEIHESTGRTLSEMNRLSHPAEKEFDFKTFVLNPDKETLYQRCDQRVDLMLEMGLLDEIERLIAQGVSPTAQSMQAIGYKQLLEFRAGKSTLPESIEQVKKATRNYAKRQLTWFRGLKEASWIQSDPTSPSGIPVRILSEFIL